MATPTAISIPEDPAALTPVPDRTFNVMVVDDEPVEHLFRLRFRDLTEGGHYRFAFAQDGLEAITRLKDNEPVDILLTDINMPRLNGISLLQQVEQLDLDIHSIVVSAYGDMRYIRTAMNSGAFDFITKPFDFADLRHTLNRTAHRLAKWQQGRRADSRLSSLQTELKTAAAIQQDILPRDFEPHEDYEIHAVMHPAKTIGGDFYDITTFPNGTLGLTVADVSDKGIPAALFMMAARTTIKATANLYRNPAKVLRHANQLLQEDNRHHMFVTMFYALYHPPTGRLSYASAGHCPPLLLRPDGHPTDMPPPTDIALALLPSATYQERHHTLAPGETLLMFTDGVTDALDPLEHANGRSTLLDILEHQRPLTPQNVNSEIMKAIRQLHHGTETPDDVTSLAIRRKPRQP